MRRNPETKCPVLIWMQVAVIALTCHETNSFGEPNEQELKARIKDIGSELQDLRQGKGAPRAYKEYRKVQEKMQELRTEHRKQLDKPRKQLQVLSQNEKVREWRNRISKKSNKLAQLRAKLQDRLQERGRKLHEQRREELSSIAAAETPRARAMGFTVLNYPAVDGSTSAQPLGLIIACKILGSPYRWAGTSRYSGRWYGGLSDSIGWTEYQPFPVAAKELPYHRRHRQLSLVGYRPVAEPEDRDSLAGKRRSVIINRMLTVHAGTHGAYENVITGKAAMGLVARRPSEDELDLARDNNVEIDVEPVALDAFVFIMNYKNPVTNLSATQIRSIYSGKLKNWQEVGGPDNRIRAYRRNRNSGSQELMETLVMTDTAFEDLDYPRSRNLVHQGMGGPYIALTHDQEGIAYSVYYYEHFMSGSPNTRLIAVDGVMPSYETIRNRTYPYVTEVYAAVLQKNAANSPVARIRKWLLSDEGQAVVRESGYVPIKGAAEGSREQQTEAM